MLTLTGIIRSTVQLPGYTDRKTGEIKSQPRDALQVEVTDDRGLVQIVTLTVPDLVDFKDRVGEVVQVPVRAWAKGANVNFSYGAA